MMMRKLSKMEMIRELGLAGTKGASRAMLATQSRIG